MGNHFHLLVKMIPEGRFTDEEIQKRFEAHYGQSRKFTEGQLPHLRNKLLSLSEFVREIKFIMYCLPGFITNFVLPVKVTFVCIGFIRRRQKS